MNPKSDFLHILTQRGFIYQTSDVEALDLRLRSGCVTAYIGFDCTAPSLHVGSLLPLMALRWLQKTGHRPLALLGGGTTQVGDPSGKDESRKLLTLEQITQNKAALEKVFSLFLTFGSGPHDALLLDNADWLTSLGYIDFLRNVGRHFSVNRMLSMDSVALRLEREQELSFLEFNYMCLQAYDFVEISKRYACILQMGGSDQWGNIVMGIDLARRMGGAQLFGLTTPLLTTASGAKMGKTAAGAVWLNDSLLSPYEYWQFWRNTEDADVGRFLRLFTELPLEEISKLEKLEGVEKNEAKKILATHATALLHGQHAADQAALAAYHTFEEGRISNHLPTVTRSFAEFKAGMGILTAFVAAGLCQSTGEARRLVQGGGARLNDQELSDPRYQLSEADVHSNGTVKLSLGRKKHVLLRFEE